MVNDRGSDEHEDGSDGTAPGTQRLDRWLWFARVVKSRTLAAKLVTDGRVRLNRERVSKPSQTVRPGDVVTLSIHRDVRVLEVKAPGVRRGPAVEAQGLYVDLAPKPPRPAPGERAQPATPVVGSRPTKRERREAQILKGRG